MRKDTSQHSVVIIDRHSSEMDYMNSENNMDDPQIAAIYKQAALELEFTPLLAEVIARQHYLKSQTVIIEGTKKRLDEEVSHNGKRWFRGLRLRGLVLNLLNRWLGRI